MYSPSSTIFGIFFGSIVLFRNQNKTTIVWLVFEAKAASAKVVTAGTIRESQNEQQWKAEKEIEREGDREAGDNIVIWYVRNFPYLYSLHKNSRPTLGTHFVPIRY